MEFKPTFLPDKKEDILKKNIELIENSNLESGKKLDLMLLLLGKKQGAQLGNFKVIESEQQQKKITQEFTQELLNILNIIKEAGLPYYMAKELSSDKGIIGFSVLVSKNNDILKKFAEADKNDDDKTFGLIVGYPSTAIETYQTDKAFDFREELSSNDLKNLQDEGVLPFLLFKPSQEHWDEELKWARENQQLIKEKSPRLYQELVQKV